MRSFVVLALVALAAVPGSALRLFNVAGSHSSVGFQVGALAKSEIATRLQRADIRQSYLPFMNTSTGQTLYSELLGAANRTYPQYVSEIVGVADGAGQPFAHVWLLVIQSELAVYLHEHGPQEYVPRDANRWLARAASHCTDVLSQPLLDEEAGIHGHNEDGGPGDKALNYLVNATIIDSATGAVLERWVAYAYAGTVAGYAGGWNRHGLTVTENILLNLRLRYDAPPGTIFGRALLAQRSIGDAIRLAMDTPGCGAGNVNLGEFLTGRQASFEYDALNNTVGVRAIHSRRPQAQLPGLRRQSPWYAHTNTYLVLQTPGWVGESSLHRLKTLHSYPQPNSTADIRRMLGDTSDPVYPVYRKGSKVDHGVTCTTTLFDLPRRSIAVYDANPRTAEPVYVFTWSPGM